MKRLLQLFSLLLLALVTARAQTISYPGGTITENFDSMGPAGTNTPPGWFVGYAGPTNLATVGVSDGSIAPNGNAGWNFGGAGAPDRSLGTMATTTGTPTPPAGTRYVEARFRNNSGQPMTNITVSYEGVQWRTGTNTLNQLVMRASVDGVAYTDLGAGFDFVQPTLTPYFRALDGYQPTNRAPGRGGTFPLASPLPSGGTLFLRWFDANEAGLDPALAIDNFSFAANAMPPPPLTVALTSIVPQTCPVGCNATATATVENGPGPVDFYLDGQLFYTDTTSPFVVTYGDLTAGTHTLAAVAHGFAGVTATSAPVTVTITNEPGFTYLIPNGSVWKYLDDGSDQGTSWRGPGFNDSGWSNGVAELGFGDGTDNRPERTVINGGPTTNRHVTAYFRHTFTVADPGAHSNLFVRLLRDDGGVAYLNGVEVFRSNFDPTNAITFDTLASNAVDEVAYFDSVHLSPLFLVAGQNVLAVEIHQTLRTSSDTSFDAMLVGQGPGGGNNTPVSIINCACLEMLPELRANACRAVIPDLCQYRQCWMAGVPLQCSQSPAPGGSVGPGTTPITLTYTVPGTSLLQSCLVNFVVTPPIGGCFSTNIVPCGAVVVTCYALNATDPVMAVIDVNNPAGNGAILGQNWAAPMYHGELPSAPATPTWTAQNLGQVFGVTLDDQNPPNIAVTAAGFYLGQAPGGPSGPGAVHRIDGQSAAVSTLASLPNSGVGLGNICYHAASGNYLVSNFEDGLIYRVPANASPFSVLYDHGAQGRPSAIPALPTLPDDGLPGTTQLGRRVWGLQTFNGRLYYSVWNENGLDNGPWSATLVNEIWSVGLNNAGNAVLPAQREIQLPPLIGGYQSANGQWSAPVSDIKFSPDGLKMLLSERSVYGAFPNPLLPPNNAHTARLLEYNLNSSGTVWGPGLGQQYYIGGPVFGDNSEGGADYACENLVWATGDLQGGPMWIYGLAGIPTTGNTPATTPLTSYFVDLDGIFDIDKTLFGDVVIRRCCCVDPPSGMVAWWPLDEPNVPASTAYQNLAAGSNPANVMSGGYVSDANSPFAMAGKVAGASFFGGSTTYGQVANPTAYNFNVGSFSVDCWVKVVNLNPPFNPWQPIVDKLATFGPNYGNGYTAGINGSGNVVLKVGDGALSGIATYTSAGIVSGNTWNFVGVAFDRAAGQVRFHINGNVEIQTQTLSALGNIDSTIPLRLGGAYGAPYISEHGLDEVELFNRALATNEFDLIWNAGSAGKCKTTNTPPHCQIAITCPNSFTNACATNATATWVTYPPPVVTHTCPLATVVCAPPSASAFPPGTTTVNCTATDTQGNSASCSFTVTIVLDTTPPVLNCDCLRELAAPLLFTNGCPAYVPDLCQFTSCYSDECCLLPCLQTPPAGTVVGPGTHPITITITDCAGNHTNCTVNFVVTCPTNLCDRLFADDTFDGNDWTLMVRSCPNPGDTTASASQIALGGNGGGPFRRIVNTLNPTTTLNYYGVIGIHLKNSATHIPSSQGALSTVDYSEYNKLFTGGGDGHSTGPALRQNGQLYIVSDAKKGKTPQSGWAPFSLNGLVAADFELVDCTKPDFRDSTQHPNFCTGSLIEFGFFRGLSSPGPGVGGSRIGDIDNWRVQLHCGGCCDGFPSLIITCPPSQTILNCYQPYVVNYSTPTVTGGKPPVSAVTCTPPSGTSFPYGTHPVTCTAVSACGQTASCSFTITVMPKPITATPDLTLTMGTPDNFLAPFDAALPGACNINAWPSYVPWKGFDDTTENRHVGVRFTGLPPAIVKAELEVRMKPTGDTFAFNDTLKVGRSSPCQLWPAPYTGSKSIALLTGAGGTWNSSQNGPTTFVIDLGVEWPPVLTQMNANPWLDVTVEDDTTVDYMRLRLWTCQPIPSCTDCDIPLGITPAGTNIVLSWAAGATNLHLEAAPSLTAPVVWSPVSAVVLEANGRRYVTLPISGAQRFFRLSDEEVAPCGWSKCDTNSPLAGRYEFTAVWMPAIGEWLIWGGYSGVTLFNDGARYNPLTKTWALMSTVNAPGPRYRHAAVAAGGKMYVWGGVGSTFFNDGGCYDPVADTWTPIPTAGAPAVRQNPSMVWSGTELIVWGGVNSNGGLNSGGRYNPGNNSWTPLPVAGAPAGRQLNGVVWTGSEMVIWGGVGGTTLGDGARYNPAANAWTPVSTVNAPSARSHFPSVWSGTEMIIWAGAGNVSPMTTGARYNPATDTWATMTTVGAPGVHHFQHAAVWTGSQMIAFGGWNGAASYNDGGCYDPVANTWTALPASPAPPPRYDHRAAWTGSEMLIWGGRSTSSATSIVVPDVWCFRKCP